MDRSQFLHGLQLPSWSLPSGFSVFFSQCSPGTRRVALWFHDLHVFLNHLRGLVPRPGPAVVAGWRSAVDRKDLPSGGSRHYPGNKLTRRASKGSGGFSSLRVGSLCGSMRNFLAGVIPWPILPVPAVLLALCRVVVFQLGVVGAFAEGFGFLTSDFGVGKSQDRGC